MVKILLQNTLEQASIKQIIIDLDQGTCLLDNGKTIPLKQMQHQEFSHPLFLEPVLPLMQGVYCHTYDDIDGLLNTAKLVYATLIQAINPATCRFKVTPSDRFLRLKSQYLIPLSLKYNKAAKEFVGVKQLEGIVKDFSKTPFRYLDNVFIDQSFSTQDLPQEINADALYTTHIELENRLQTPDQLTNIELRYINRFIGFGVYARQDIKKGDLILIYCGKKSLKKPKESAYYFLPFSDQLNMGIDAKNFGNITRFINHAPLPKSGKDQAVYLEANLKNSAYSLRGMDCIVYEASRDIAKNEQLLADYGRQSFTKLPALRFNLKSQPLDEELKKVHESHADRVGMLRAMAANGFRAAWFSLYWRVVLVVLVVVAIYFYFK